MTRESVTAAALVAPAPAEMSVGPVPALVVVRARGAELRRNVGAVRAERRLPGRLAHGLQPVGAGAVGPAAQVIPKIKVIS